ncbi:MAG TPA: bifunctional anthranilate synthase component I family protein/class IV aminotransferase [Propionicimonas sp.]|jgi:para-aminobenzoate synthetase/4-amino-4-deoxychorismate lyase|uniref:bifunctional chorismate-binding protein/class IV aminotransferase n=1 Tax=Propionicimonas sp. TaxID=1955623 RepID=UPI002F4204DE
MSVLTAATAGEVPAVVAAAEHAALAGNWVVGGLSYSAAGAWDRAQRALLDSPAAHFEVYAAVEDWPAEATPLPALDWREDTALAGGVTPQAAIGAVREHIAAGDCYQVNLTGRWRAVRPVSLDPFGYFAALAAAQPGGYAVYCAGAGVASVSPELFFHSGHGRLVTQPMKGTLGAEHPPEALLASEKDRAENLMIVDLLRNDLGRVCEPGTVTVDRLFELHRLPTVWQLTSTVTGRPRPGTGLVDAFAALFPCGSVTGAPKLAAMAVIAELEDDPRAWYCGAFGVIRPGGTATFNVPIRTVVLGERQLTCGIGSGIVADSDAAAEVAEWRAKARFLGAEPLRALETMLAVDGRIQREDAHLARLVGCCADLGLPLDPDRVRAALRVATPASGRHRVRLVAGDGPPVIAVTPAPPAGVPVRLQLAAEPLDVAGLAPVIRNKTTHRAHYQRLRDLATSDVFDVICHTGTEVTECCLGNLAVKLDGEWFTPPATAGLLPGTLRAELLASGRIRERTVRLEDLAEAEGLAFLNGVRGWCAATLVAR